MDADHFTTIKRIKEIDRVYRLLKIVTWNQYLVLYNRTMMYDHYYDRTYDSSTLT